MRSLFYSQVLFASFIKILFKFIIAQQNISFYSLTYDAIMFHTRKSGLRIQNITDKVVDRIQTYTAMRFATTRVMKKRWLGLYGLFSTT